MKKIDKNLVKEISKLMDELKLLELEYSDNGNSLKLKKESKNIQNLSSIKEPVFQKEEKKKNDSQNIDKSIKAPLVGTVYLSPEPGAKPFVEVGQNVKTGQVLLIIEAMKTMNEITSQTNGKIQKIYVADSNPVEFGEPLILIE